MMDPVFRLNTYIKKQNKQIKTKENSFMLNELELLKSNDLIADVHAGFLMEIDRYKSNSF